MSQNVVRIDGEINDVLTSPATTYWLKHALGEAMRRDCVDAARDAGHLAALLSRRCDAVLGRA